MIKPNTCPYCDGPYTLAKPCECAGMTAHHTLIALAVEIDPGEEHEPLVVIRRPASEVS